MSERGGGFGAFLFGIVLGAVAGFLFAPEGGGDTRKRVGKGLRSLKALAEEKVDEVKGLLEEVEEEAEEEVEEEDEAPEVATREQLRRRLQAARRRRGRPAVREQEEEDEPLA